MLYSRFNNLRIKNYKMAGQITLYLWEEVRSEEIYPSFFKAKPLVARGKTTSFQLKLQEDKIGNNLTIEKHLKGGNALAILIVQFSQEIFHKIS